MSLSVMRKLPLEEEVMGKIYARILDLPAMRGLCWDISSPEVIEGIMEEINRAMGDSDPLHTAVKLAIIGKVLGRNQGSVLIPSREWS